MIPKYKVLIVEDEVIVALELKSALEDLGLKVIDCVINFDDAIASVYRHIPDLILMDINLDNSKDGIETAIAIKNIKNIPLIYLTAFCDDETINRAVATNPLHYMTKPFKRDDLKSTIKLSIYKLEQENRKKSKLIVGENLTIVGNGYYYDQEHQSLFYHNIPMKLGIKEKKLLNIPLNARGNIVSFDQLIYEIWPEETVSDSTLRTLIYRLRMKLEHRLIETIPSFGCKLLI